MSQVATTYAQALYSLIKEDGSEKAVLEQMKVLDESFSQEKDFVRLLSAPNVAKETHCAILDDSFRGKVHPYLLNFMKILTEKGYIRYFSECCQAYREQYNEENGILPVCAVTAVELTEDQTAKLKAKLEKITGKTVELVNRTDPTCLGGVRLDYDGRQVDGTIKNRLDSIHGLLKNTVL